MSFPEWMTGQANPEVPVTEAFDILQYAAVYGRDPDVTTGLTWGYLGGRWSGFAITADDFTLTDDDDNFMVVARATGVASCSNASTNWNDTADYARVYKITAASGLVTVVEDHRGGDGGIFGSSGGGGVSGVPPVVTESGTSLAADDTNAGNYTRFTNSSAKTYTFDDGETYATGAEYHGRNVGAGDLTLTEAGGFTLNPPAGGTLVVPEGGTFTVKIVAADEADVIGVTVDAP